MKPSDQDPHCFMLCKGVLTTGRLHDTGIGMLHVNRNIVGRSVLHEVIFSMTRVKKVIYQATSLSLWSTLSHFNKIMKSMLRHSYLSRLITSG